MKLNLIIIINKMNYNLLSRRKLFICVHQHHIKKKLYFLDYNQFDFDPPLNQLSKFFSSSNKKPEKQKQTDYLYVHLANFDHMFILR